MAQFKVRSFDGTERTVEAKRVSREGTRLIFHDRTRESWVRVCELPGADVSGVRRRIVEPNGSMRWITEPLPDPDEGRPR